MENKYGWENQRGTVWLNHFNNQLLKKGIITPEEYRKMQAIISNHKVEQ